MANKSFLYGKSCLNQVCKVYYGRIHYYTLDICTLLLLITLFRKIMSRPFRFRWCINFLSSYNMGRTIRRNRLQHFNNLNNFNNNLHLWVMYVHVYENSEICNPTYLYHWWLFCPHSVTVILGRDKNRKPHLIYLPIMNIRL